MICLLLALSSSLQINRLFTLDQVQHILRERLPKPKLFFIAYGDLQGYKGMIEATSIPKHAIVSYEADRLHLFVHDKERICRCVWDGQVRFDEKKEIMKNVFMWWQETTNSCLDHRLVDYEDGLAFTETMEDLECTLKDTDADEL